MIPATLAQSFLQEFSQGGTSQDTFPPLAEQGAAPEPSPDQTPPAAGLGDAQEWDIPAPEQFHPWRGCWQPPLLVPAAGQGLGSAAAHSKGLRDDPDFKSSPQISEEWGAGLQTLC